MVRICIPVYDRIDALDVVGPYEMFNWAGFTIDVVAAAPGSVAVSTQAPNALGLTVTKSFADAGPCDAMWVPGGDPDALSQMIYGADQTYLDFIKAQAARSDFVCSVCEGAILLAAAGLLDGYQATTHWAFEPCFVERYPAVQLVPGHPRYVFDRNRLTGGGISSGLDEALALIERLAGTGKAISVQQTTQYYPDPPVNSQIPPPPPTCYVRKP